MTVLVGSTGARAAEGDPAITGSIRGDLAHSPQLSFDLAGTAPGGWQDIQQFQVALLLHSVVLDQILIDRPTGTVTTASSLPVKLGTADEAAGTYFTVTGKDVALIAKGSQLNVTIRARVVQGLPEGAIFSLGVIDRWGRTDRISRAVQLPQKKTGFSWGTLAAAVVGALFVGSLFGGLFASRRRPSARPSIYAVVQRRMDEERARS
jgi:hypothetical protein